MTSPHANLLKAALVACLVAGTAPAFGGGSSTVGVPNPASKFCVDNGGSLVMVNQDNWAFCKIGDAMIEEWTLFRAGQAHQPETATDLFLGDGTVSCTDAGG